MASFDAYMSTEGTMIANIPEIYRNGDCLGTAQIALRNSIQFYLSQTEYGGLGSKEPLAIKELGSILPAFERYRQRMPIIFNQHTRVIFTSCECCSHSMDLPGGPDVVYDASYWNHCRANARCGWGGHSMTTMESSSSSSSSSSILSSIRTSSTWNDKRAEFLDLICDGCLLAAFGGDLATNFYDYAICVACGGWHRMVVPRIQCARRQITFGPCSHYPPGGLHPELVDSPNYLSLSSSSPTPIFAAAAAAVTVIRDSSDPAPGNGAEVTLREEDMIPSTFDCKSLLSSSPPPPPSSSLSSPPHLPLPPLTPVVAREETVGVNTRVSSAKRKSSSSPMTPPPPAKRPKKTTEVATKRKKRGAAAHPQGGTTTLPAISFITNVYMPNANVQHSMQHLDQQRQQTQYIASPGVAPPMISRMSSRSHLGHPAIVISRIVAKAKSSSMPPPPPPAVSQMITQALPIHVTHTNLTSSMITTRTATTTTSTSSSTSDAFYFAYNANDSEEEPDAPEFPPDEMYFSSHPGPDY